MLFYTSQCRMILESSMCTQEKLPYAVNTYLDTNTDKKNTITMPSPFSEPKPASAYTVQYVSQYQSNTSKIANKHINKGRPHGHYSLRPPSQNASLQRYPLHFLLLSGHGVDRACCHASVSLKGHMNKINNRLKFIKYQQKDFKLKKKYHSPLKKYCLDYHHGPSSPPFSR